MTKTRKPKASGLPTIDLSHMRAATILARQPEDEPINILLVGCGGTGSYMAMHIGRVLHALGEKGLPARAVFMDHDHVEPRNVGRQLFCNAEIGLNKAEALALRYGTAWGLDVVAIPERFSAPKARGGQPELLVIVGCVDNAAARKEISKVLALNPPNSAPHIWWLDCGNYEEGGQVLLGSAVAAPQLKGAFPSPEICRALPAPSIQSPELLKARREETKAAKKMSCAELVAANTQSLNVNAAVAAQAVDMLTRLLVTRNLKRFACEFNLAAGSMKSTPATPEAAGCAFKPSKAVA